MSRASTFSLLMRVSRSIPYLFTSIEAMSAFCPFTAPVVTPSLTWRQTFPSMSFDADALYLGQLWELARPRGEDCSQNQDQHLERPEKTTRKSTTLEIGKLLRRATAKTLRYAQRDHHRRHNDNTYIVLHNLLDDESSGEDCARRSSDSDFSASNSFRSSLSLRAERIMRRRRR